MPPLHRIATLALLAVIVPAISHGGGNAPQPGDVGSGAPPLFYPKTAYGFATEVEARAAWDHLREIGALRDDPGPALILLHHYSVEGFAPETAEWIVIATSAAGDEVRIWRLRHRDLALVASDRIPIEAGAPVDTTAAAEIINAHPAFAERSWSASPEAIERVGEQYVFFREATDFGATAVVHRRAGKLVMAATTVAIGSGKLMLPEPGN